ncbi:hypothetical protein AVEN_60846-1, partial [Araneus ventricosus]
MKRQRSTFLKFIYSRGLFEFETWSSAAESLSLGLDVADSLALLVDAPAAVVVVPALLGHPLAVFSALRDVGVVDFCEEAKTE